MQHILARLVLALSLVVVCNVVATAQYHRERGLVREGNKQFERRNFKSALNRYEEAMEHDSMAYEVLYNRANASAQVLLNEKNDSAKLAERWAISNKYYDALAADSLLSDTQRAEVLRNLGESLFRQQNYEAALNSFRESLLLNGDDAETKHNYILTKRIVDQKRRQQQQNQEQGGGGDNRQQDGDDQQQNQNQQGQNDNNQDPNKSDQNGNNQQDDQNRDNQNKDDQDKNSQQDNQNRDGRDKEDKNDDGRSDDKQDGNGQQEPQPSGMSRGEQERMLDAIQAEEDKTQDKLKEGKAVYVPGKKNW